MLKNKQKAIRMLILIVIAVVIIGTGKWLWTAIQPKKAIVINNQDKKGEEVESKIEYEIVDTTVEQLKDNKPLTIVAVDKISYVDSLWSVYGYIYDNKVITNYMIGEKEDPKTIAESNKLYLLDISTGNKELLVDKYSEIKQISADGMKVIYQTSSEDNIVNYIYDVKIKQKKILGKGIIGGVFSKDSSKFIFCNWNDNVINKINIYDIKNDKVSSIGYNSKDIKLGNVIGIESDDLYFSGAEQKNDNIRQGVYKLNLKDSSDTKMIFAFPFNKKSNCLGIAGGDRGANFNVINNGNSIIFSGVINKKWGIFIFDIASNKIYQVALTNNINYYLSPDKSKLIYVYSSEGNSDSNLNVYADSIENNKLYNITEIKLDNNIINADAFWSVDSKKALLLEYGEKDLKTMACPRYLKLVTLENK